MKVVFTLFTLLATFFLGIFFWVLHHQVVDFSPLERYAVAQPSILLDDEGVEWARFELDKREPISLKDVPFHVIQAFLAAEDRGFYSHHGISIRGIVRSTLVNIRHGRMVQGASTITQQLVKLLFFDSQKTLKRKIKEQLLALLVERQFTKDQILETYLNHIYFGCGIYGISAAAQRFFGKPVQALDYGEAAVLAGIQRCPAVYCPLLNKEASQKRRNVVLSMMMQEKYITPEEYAVYREKPLMLAVHTKETFAPYVKEYIRQQLEEMIGKQALYTQGYKIQTTLNRTLQCAAEKHFYNQFNHIRREIGQESDGGLVSLDVQTGEVKALIGGVDYAKSQFNRATQARRQVGSVVKPFVYAAALERGYTFADTEIDEPIEVLFQGSSWMPRNYNKKFSGEITLAKALSSSNNIVTVKTMLKVGPQRVADLLYAAGIVGPIDAYPALALGCVDATLLEVAGAFNVFAHDGMYVRPHLVTWIKDKLGKKIWVYEPYERRVFDAHIAHQVTKVLTNGIKRHLTRMKSSVSYDVMGKTGTTNDSRTCWFSGSSPLLTTALYVGNDNNSPLGETVFPTWTVFPVWLSVYQSLRPQKRNFVYHPGLQEITIDGRTGKTTLLQDEHTMTILV